MPKGQIKFTKEDRDWAERVKIRDEYRCIICGTINLLNAHHIIPRENHTFKYNILNGVTLCSKHHMFSREISAHNNPLAFFKWLELNRPAQYLYLKALV